MSTEKEREIIREILELAMDIGAGDHDVSLDYSGHIHAVAVRISKKHESGFVFYGEHVYLSGRIDLWDESTSIEGLTSLLDQVKKYHPDFDSEGIPL